MLYQLPGKRVTIAKDCFVAKNAIVVGQVVLGRGSSVWFNAVIRADNDLIQIGAESNIQESAVLHTDAGFQLVVAERVSVGHHATLHGCSVGEGSLIGINSVVLNGAKIGKNCLIGANALVPEGVHIPDGSMVLGSPGKVRRSLTEAEIVSLRESAAHYCAKAQLFKSELKPQTDE
ncbi:MAG: gamma carbonic anhydrase family protein [Gammaproteobacteria bacterium]|nr:MAG: gamma carbonic anhydrase family protein [Gammaproteobacteria bacterium]